MDYGCWRGARFGLGLSLILAPLPGPQEAAQGVMPRDRVVAFRRQSKQGGSLVFLLNVEDKTAKARVQPRWGISAARDLLDDRELALSAGGFEVEMALGQVCVVHCTDA